MNQSINGTVLLEVICAASSINPKVKQTRWSSPSLQPHSVSQFPSIRLALLRWSSSLSDLLAKCGARVVQSTIVENGCPLVRTLTSISIPSSSLCNSCHNLSTMVGFKTFQRSSRITAKIWMTLLSTLLLVLPLAGVLGKSMTLPPFWWAKSSVCCKYNLFMTWLKKYQMT